MSVHEYDKYTWPLHLVDTNKLQMLQLLLSTFIKQYIMIRMQNLQHIGLLTLQKNFNKISIHFIKCMST